MFAPRPAESAFPQQQPVPSRFGHPMGPGVSAPQNNRQWHHIEVMKKKLVLSKTHHHSSRWWIQSARRADKLSTSARSVNLNSCEQYMDSDKYAKYKPVYLTSTVYNILLSRKRLCLRLDKITTSQPFSLVRYFFVEQESSPARRLIANFLKDKL